MRIFLLFFLLVIVLLSSLVHASCTVAQRTTVNPLTNLTACVRVGVYPDSVIPDEEARYFAKTLPERIWTGLRRDLESRGVIVEFVQTSHNFSRSFDSLITPLADGLPELDLFIGGAWRTRSANKTQFTLPYLGEQLALLYKIRESDEVTFWYSWTSPFEATLWVAAFATIIIGALVIATAEIINHAYGGEPHQQLARNDENVREDPFLVRMWHDIGWLRLVLSSFYHAIGTIFGTFYGIFPRSFGGWMISWALRMFMFVIIASYTANLASFLSLKRKAEPLTAAELVQRPIAVYDEAAITTHLLEISHKSTDGNLRFRAETTESEYLQALEVHDSLLLPELIALPIYRRNCKLEITKLPFAFDHALRIRKSTEMFYVKQTIDEGILKLKDLGVIERWIQAGLAPDRCNRTSSFKDSEMGLQETGGSFLVAAGSFVLAIILTVGHWLYRRSELVQQDEGRASCEALLEQLRLLIRDVKRDAGQLRVWLDKWSQFASTKDVTMKPLFDASKKTADPDAWTVEKYLTTITEEDDNLENEALSQPVVNSEGVVRILPNIGPEVTATDSMEIDSQNLLDIRGASMVLLTSIQLAEAALNAAGGGMNYCHNDDTNEVYIAHELAMACRWGLRSTQEATILALDAVQKKLQTANASENDLYGAALICWMRRACRAAAVACVLTAQSVKAISFTACHTLSANESTTLQAESSAAAAVAAVRKFTEGNAVERPRFDRVSPIRNIEKYINTPTLAAKEEGTVTEDLPS